LACLGLVLTSCTSEAKKASIKKRTEARTISVHLPTLCKSTFEWDHAQVLVYEIPDIFDVGDTICIKHNVTQKKWYYNTERLWVASPKSGLIGASLHREVVINRLPLRKVTNPARDLAKKVMIGKE
jgi:hypothetical protein